MKKALLIGLLISTMVIGTFAQESKIFSLELGSYDVFMMVETQRQGNPEILIGANDALLKRYIPEGGYMHSTNTFLIKAPDRNILIDTGLGEAIFDHLDELEVSPESINAILITHLHGDHFSGLQKDGKALFPNAKVYLSKRELDYWTRTNVNQAAVAALIPYGSRVETFEPSLLDGKLSELLPGIFPIANYGHTPGHTIYLVENNGENIIICGDMMHVGLVQIPNPDISATYDTNPKAAAVVRWQVLTFAAHNNFPIGGMHLVYPGIGSVRELQSRYTLAPVEENKYY